MDVRDAIRDYINHISEPAFVNAILSEPAPTVFGTLQDMLHDPEIDMEGDDRHWASLFMGDACRHGTPFGQFRKNLLDSGLMSTLRELGISGDFVGRGHAVEALNQIGGRAALDILMEIFERYITRDPLLLARILATVPMHVHEKDRWALMRRLASSDLYLIRWVVLSTNGTILGFPSRAHDGKRARPLLTRLAKDPVSWLAADASFRLEEWRVEASGRGWDSALIAPPLKDLPIRQLMEMATGEGFGTELDLLRKSEPQLNFFAIEQYFGQRIYRQGLVDYTLDELDSFVRDLAVELGANK